MTKTTGRRIIYSSRVGNVYEVAWNSGEKTLRFDFNPLRHLKGNDEIKRFARAMWSAAYPDNPKRRAENSRYWNKNKEKYNEKRRKKN